MHSFFCLVIFSFLPFFGATVNGWRLVEGSHLWGHWWLPWYFSKDGWKGCVLADKSPLGCGEPSCGRENRCLLPVVGQWWTNGLVQSFNHQLNKFQNERFTPNLCSTEHRDCRWSWFKTWFKSAVISPVSLQAMKKAKDFNSTGRTSLTTQQEGLFG